MTEPTYTEDDLAAAEAELAEEGDDDPTTDEEDTDEASDEPTLDKPI